MRHMNINSLALARESFFRLPLECFVFHWYVWNAFTNSFDQFITACLTGRDTDFDLLIYLGSVRTWNLDIVVLQKLGRIYRAARQ